MNPRPDVLGRNGDSPRGESAAAPDERRRHTRARYLARFWKAFLEAPSSPGNAFPQADRWLAQALKGERALGSSDRRWYADAFFDLLRKAPTRALALTAGRSPDSLAVGHSGAQELREKSLALSRDPIALKVALLEIDPAALDSFPVNPFPRTEVDAALWDAGIPLWLAGPLARRALSSAWSADESLKFVGGQSTRPPLWIRLQHPEARAAVETELREAGFAFRRAEGNPDAWLLEGARGLYTLEAYKKGHIEIQDLASQGIGSALGVERRHVVWDSCAGGGGKTLQIAALLSNSGAVFASDVRSYKLDEVKERARRAGFQNVRTLPWNGDALPALPKEASLRGGFDRVLVDAPCSAAGTWRRNPDAKLRVSPEMLAELAGIQRGILEKVCNAVRPGGLLVYSTCSWLVEENEDVVGDFLASHPEFSQTECRMLGWPHADADAMFVAVLRNGGGS